MIKNSQYHDSIDAVLTKFYCLTFLFYKLMWQMQEAYKVRWRSQLLQKYKKKSRYLFQGIKSFVEVIVWNQMTKINCWSHWYFIYNWSENCIKISGKNEKWNCWKESKMLDEIVIYQIVMLSRPETNENSECHMNGI